MLPEDFSHVQFPQTCLHNAGKNNSYVYDACPPPQMLEEVSETGLTASSQGRSFPRLHNTNSVFNRMSVCMEHLP